MRKQTLTLSSKVLITILTAGDLILGMRGRVIDSVYNPHLDPDRSMKRTLYYLFKKGWIRYEDKEGKRYIKLTKQGKLKTLLLKFNVNKDHKWNGKWCVVVFDIPESTAKLRSQLVYQLRELSFVKLQASVYISPYALNEEAMEYLRTTKLIDYLRIMTVEKLDDDRKLKEKFGLI
jgi:phenylacetic acid degradation operon negative regulatory protein